MFIRAASKEDKDKWIRALEINVDLAKGGAGDSIVSRNKTSSKKKVDSSLRTELDRTDVLLQQVAQVEASRKENSVDIRGNVAQFRQPKIGKPTRSKQSADNDVYDLDGTEVYDENF
jgi:hypothetical protein